jgi:hypothetical protein
MLTRQEKVEVAVFVYIFFSVQMICLAMKDYSERLSEGKLG